MKKSVELNPGREVSKIEEDRNVCKEASKTQKEKLDKLKDHVKKAKDRLENMEKEVTGKAYFIHNYVSSGNSLLTVF